MDPSSPIGLASNLLSRPVKRLFRSLPKEPGAAPGTLVYTGPKRSEPASVHLLEYDRDVVAEWYENRPEGLEQGFTVREYMEGSDTIEIVLRINGNTRPVLSNDKATVDFLTDSHAKVLTYSNLHVFDADGNNLSSYLDLKNNRLKIIINSAVLGSYHREPKMHLDWIRC